MIIRQLDQSETDQVAGIHFRYLKQGVLPLLGESFLNDFYKILLYQKNIITYVVVQNNKIVGFATCGSNSQNLPWRMIKGLWPKILSALFKNPPIFFKLIHLPFYPGFRGMVYPNNQKAGEIFSLVVVPTSRGQGIGAALIDKCRWQLKKSGCKYFVLSVRVLMKEANSFYKRIGLKKMKTTKFLGESFIFWKGTI